MNPDMNPETAAPTTPAKSAPHRQTKLDQLTFAIQEAVAAINPRGLIPEYYRELVKLGNKNRHDLRGFRRSLIAAGLAEPRASEILVILKSEAIATDFAEDRIKFRDALKQARIKLPKPSADPANDEEADDYERKEAALVSILRAMDALLEQAAVQAQRNQGATCWPMDVGIYRLNFQPKAAPGAVKTS